MKQDPQRVRDGSRRNALAAAAALIGMSVGIAATVPTDASAQTQAPANKPYNSNYLKINTSNQYKKPTTALVEQRAAPKPATLRKIRKNNPSSKPAKGKKPHRILTR